MTYDHIGIYPELRPWRGSVVGVNCGQLSHAREFPTDMLPKAYRHAGALFAAYGGDLTAMRAGLAALLADMPEGALAAVPGDRKAAALGHLALACALHDPGCPRAVRRAMDSGRAVVVYRLVGEAAAPGCEVEVFPHHAALARHLADRPDPEALDRRRPGEHGARGSCGCMPDRVGAQDPKSMR